MTINSRFNNFGTGFFTGYFLLSIVVYITFLFYADVISGAYRSIFTLLIANFFIYVVTKREYDHKRIIDEIEVCEVGNMRR